MMAQRTIKVKKRVALVAHDKRKEELLQWVQKHEQALAQQHLIGTGSTAKIVEKETGLKLERVISGPLGGDQQLGAMIAEGRMDLVVFFWDPLEAQPHDSDVKALIRLAVAWNIIIACNITTADFVMASSLMQQPYQMHVPDTEE